MEPVTKNLPVIAMRGLNVFPRMNTSFDLERPISVHALERAMENGEEIFLVTQREIGVEQPEEKDLYEIGTVARVTQILRVSDRVLRVMMEGACRARLKRLWQREPFLQAQVELIDEPATSCHSKRTEAMLRQTYASVTEYAELAQKLPDDVYAAILSTNDPGYLADFIAQQLNLRYQDKQDILDELRPLPRLQRMNEILRREIEVTAMEQDIESKVRSRVGKIQKDFVLREQIKVLQNEIGEGRGGRRTRRVPREDQQGAPERRSGAQAAERCGQARQAAVRQRRGECAAQLSRHLHGNALGRGDEGARQRRRRAQDS